MLPMVSPSLASESSRSIFPVDLAVSEFTDRGHACIPASCVT